MARIIYGVAGQGFGHASRSKEIINRLKQKGHEIFVFTYGQGLFLLPADLEIFEIPGLGLSYKDNHLIYWRTVFNNTKKVIKQSPRWKEILNRFQAFKPDLVITDFEPVTALLAKIKHLPLVSIDNQHQLTHTKISLPSEYRRDFLMTQFIIKSMVWKADYYLITSFFESPITRKRAFLLPPIVRQEVLALNSAKGDYFLVYLTSDFGRLVEELKKINQKFVVFGMNLEKTEDNIVYKNYCLEEWLIYLANCRAIIGNAGLSLISEALYLKKPYLAVPVARQIEQIVNALYLDKKGYGQFTFNFTQEVFTDFYAHLADFEQNLAAYPHQNNEAIFQKLDEIVAGL